MRGTGTRVSPLLERGSRLIGFGGLFRRFAPLSSLLDHPCHAGGMDIRGVGCSLPSQSSSVPVFHHSNTPPLHCSQQPLEYSSAIANAPHPNPSIIPVLHHQPLSHRKRAPQVIPSPIFSLPSPGTKCPPASLPAFPCSTLPSFHCSITPAPSQPPFNRRKLPLHPRFSFFLETHARCDSMRP